MHLIYFSIVFLFCVHTVTPHIYLFDIHHDYHERNAEIDHNFHLKLFPPSTPAPSSDIVEKLKTFYQNEKLTAKPRKNKCERNFGSIFGTKIQKNLCIEKMRGEKSVERGRGRQKKEGETKEGLLRRPLLMKQNFPYKQKINHFPYKQKATKMFSGDYLNINDLNRQDFDDSFSDDYLDINDLLRAKAERALPVDYFEYLFLEKLSFGGPKQPKKCNSKTKKTRKFNLKNRKTRFQRLKKTKNKLFRNPKRFEVVRDINDYKKPKIWNKYKGYASEETKKPKNYEDLFDSEENKKPKKNNDFFDSEETKKPKENNDFFDSEETKKPKKYKDYFNSEETGKPKKIKKYNDFFDSEVTKKPKKSKKNSDFFDSEEVKKPKNLDRFKEVHNPGVKNAKFKKYNKHGSKVTKKPKHVIKYSENSESEESDDTKNSQSKEFYIQGNNLIETDKDGRRRLPSFLPKRYHWKPEEIHELGYYWFNGPRGQYPDPVPLRR